TYRNWVINALNADMPYDQFVKNQLAADQLAPAEAVMQVSLAGAPLKPAPEVRNLAALGFLTVNDRFLGDRALQTDDRIDVVGRGLLGLTIGCARCHDHKYDPVSSVDYYALYGVFNSSEVPDETLMPVIGRPTDDGAVSEFQKKVSEVEGRMQAFRSEVLEDVRQPERLRDYLVFVQQNLNAESAAFRGAAGKAMMRDRFAERWRDFLKRFSATEKPHPVMFAWRKFSEIPAAEFDQKAPAILAAVKAAPEAECNRVVAEALTKREGGVHSLTDVADVYGRLFVEHLGDQPLADKQHESIRALMRGGVAPMQIEVGQADGFFTRKDRDKMTKMENEIKKLEIEDPGAPFRAMVMTDKAKPANQRVMIRGNPGRLGDAAPRAYPAFFGGQPFEHGSGRLELAERVASQDNPLTARVLVNRVWMHHFGKPLVSQPSDFGVQTPRPVQAELLDWLAARFMEEGWSIKKLHRHILNSRTYRQSSNVTPVKREKDADNALLSRMNRQRLDYESLRDGMLQVTGSLDLTRKPGRAVPLSAAEADQCRSIMLLVDRYEQPTVPAMFDFANPDSHTPERFVTTVPQQTLFLMNSPFMRQRADALAATLPVLGSTPDASTIQTLFERVLTRPASAEEVELAGRFLADATTMSAPRDHWEYGTFKLKLDEKAGSQPQFAEWIRFKTYEDKNHRWSPTGKVPDPQWSYAFLTNTTGHAAGSNLCPTARWQAPEDQTLHFRAEIKRPSEHGNGIRAWLVSDRQGVLTEASVAPNSTAVLTKSAVSVRAGEWISLVFDAIQGETSHDSFNWSLTVHQADNGQLLTDSKADFCGPNGRPIDGRLPPQSPLSQLSQVMLMSNAFQFVD
ncbi:MAG: DUF1553 domain-containing protein, partial [Verrucomicrobiales bacterium]|nr:DUF1553 domain-containing protein [Verrucomicrobiales bacterium]